MQRLARAHANCIEGLPIFGGLMLVAVVIGRNGARLALSGTKALAATTWVRTSFVRMLSMRTRRNNAHAMKATRANKVRSFLGTGWRGADQASSAVASATPPAWASVQPRPVLSRLATASSPSAASAIARDSVIVRASFVSSPMPAAASRACA